jgi:hypothetical protein
VPAEKQIAQAMHEIKAFLFICLIDSGPAAENRRRDRVCVLEIGCGNLALEFLARPTGKYPANTHCTVPDN